MVPQVSMAGRNHLEGYPVSYHITQEEHDAIVACFDKGWTYREIAGHLSKSLSTVARVIKETGRAGREKHPRRIQGADLEELIVRYNRGDRLEDLADYFQVTSRCITMTLRRAGIGPRRLGKKGRL
jgi:transposase